MNKYNEKLQELEFLKAKLRSTCLDCMRECNLKYPNRLVIDKLQKETDELEKQIDELSSELCVGG